jgi:hypothetical protein
MGGPRQAVQLPHIATRYSGKLGDMQWASIVPAAITGVVGLAGIVGSVLSAKLGINAEHKLAHTSEKRRIYAAFNSAVEGLWFIATSSEDFTIDPGRFHYNQAMSLLWSTYYEVSLMTSGRVSVLAIDVTNTMTQFANDLKTLKGNRGGHEPSGFNKKREDLVNAMRTDLGEHGRASHFRPSNL